MANFFRSTLKVGAVAAGAILVFFGVKYIVSAIKTSAAGDKINIKVSNARIHKLSLSGIDIKANVQVQNPTSTQVSFTSPFVRILSKGSTIASSDISDKVYDLTPMSQLNLQEININLPLINVLGFLTQIKFSFPATADTLIKKIVYLGTQIKTVAKNFDLKLAYSTVANGFNYESSSSIIADDTITT